eukprot:TRINITY_DN3464_c0_g1_i1.p1 TRINITY_DN3464_c0_g1~~TRINITY_DN3464_c0_g1_i1.p1  ORF type:complete len:809 (-),score=175.47 TRINITY_DN3464_c0_g1_i1:286-2712(-)
MKFIKLSCLLLIFFIVTKCSIVSSVISQGPTKTPSRLKFEIDLTISDATIEEIFTIKEVVDSVGIKYSFDPAIQIGIATSESRISYPLTLYDTLYEQEEIEYTVTEGYCPANCVCAQKTARCLKKTFPIEIHSIGDSKVSCGILISMRLKDSIEQHSLSFEEKMTSKKTQTTVEISMQTESNSVDYSKSSYYLGNCSFLLDSELLLDAPYALGLTTETYVDYYKNNPGLFNLIKNSFLITDILDEVSVIENNETKCESSYLIEPLESIALNIVAYVDASSVEITMETPIADILDFRVNLYASGLIVSLKMFNSLNYTLSYVFETVSCPSDIRVEKDLEIGTNSIAFSIGSYDDESVDCSLQITNSIKTKVLLISFDSESIPVIDETAVALESNSESCPVSYYTVELDTLTFCIPPCSTNLKYDEDLHLCLPNCPPTEPYYLPNTKNCSETPFVTVSTVTTSTAYLQDAFDDISEEIDEEPSTDEKSLKYSCPYNSYYDSTTQSCVCNDEKAVFQNDGCVTAVDKDMITEAKELFIEQINSLKIQICCVFTALFVVVRIVITCCCGCCCSKKENKNELSDDDLFSTSEDDSYFDTGSESEYLSESSYASDQELKEPLEIIIGDNTPLSLVEKKSPGKKSRSTRKSGKLPKSEKTPTPKKKLNINKTPPRTSIHATEGLKTPISTPELNFDQFANRRRVKGTIEKISPKHSPSRNSPNVKINEKAKAIGVKPNLVNNVSKVEAKEDDMFMHNEENRQKQIIAIQQHNLKQLRRSIRNSMSFENNDKKIERKINADLPFNRRRVKRAKNGG